MGKLTYLLFTFVQLGLSFFNLKSVHGILDSWYGWESAAQFTIMIGLYYIWRFTGNTNRIHKWAYWIVRVLVIFICAYPIYQDCGLCVQSVIFTISSVFLDLSFELKFDKKNSSKFD